MMKGRAPGKVLLFGEHAVVYGHPAIAAAVDKYLTVLVEPADTADVPEPFIAIAREAGWTRGFTVEITSEIPFGSGLGSSAALGVALARAFKPQCSAEEAARLAMKLETVLHGAPSGVDPAACAHGGVIWFVRGRSPEPLRLNAWLVVALSGVARGTHTTVLSLAERRKTDPRVDALLEKLGKIALEARAHLSSLPALGVLMDDAHAALRELGVSCPELEAAVGRLKSAGALGAKLTGAGGGGAAIGLARDEAHAREIAAKTGGFAVEIGAP